MANKALDFDGSSGDKVIVTDDSAIQNIFDKGGTIEFMLRTRSDGGDNQGIIVDKNRWASIVRNEVAGELDLQFSHQFTGDDYIAITTSNVIVINTDYHIVITYNSGSVSNLAIMYVNADVKANGTTVPTGTRNTDVGSNLSIGPHVAVATRLSDGPIYEIRFYTRIMGQAEVTANYNGGAFRDWPSNMNNLVGWWKFNEGTGSTTRDETNRGNTGVITTASWVNGFDFLEMKHVPRRR